MSFDRSLEKEVQKYGDDVKEDCLQKNRMLGKTISGISGASKNESTLIASLNDLERTMKKMDPGLVDFNKHPKIAKFLSPITKYFREFEKEESSVENIITSLEKGKSILANDNITIEIEKRKLEEMVSNLKELLHKGEEWYQELMTNLSMVEESEKGEYQNRILKVLERKLYDFKEMIVVNEQTILAMEVIMRNNSELMRNVDRVQSVTISAMNTAVMLASSLNNQKITLSKLNALNTQTSRLTHFSSQNMAQAVSVDSLKSSFQEAYDLYDELKNEGDDFLPENEIKVAEIQTRMSST